MYRKGDLVEDFTVDRTYAREILDPGNTAADALLTHLNRG
jgi:hypothetical protein